MLIDWFTVIAQALNFLILVWLLRRFLYRPVLNAIDAREKRIAAELADAADSKAEARKERDEFQRKNEELKQQRATLLTKAQDEAAAERQQLMAAARTAADAVRAQRQESLRAEAQKFNQALSLRLQQEVFAITRQALTDLAGVSLEERLGEVFTRRLRELDAQAKAGLGRALSSASTPALVRSAFALPTEQRSAIQNALNETFSAEVPVRFETATDLIGGIELTANGQKLEWSIRDYLASMERRVTDLMKEKGLAPAQVAPKSQAPTLAKTNP